jgi:hypothetical protein
MKRPETASRQVPFAKRWTRFERCLAHARITREVRAILETARGLARRGRIDLRVLAGRTGQSIASIYRLRERLDPPGLWPWATDKSSVGAPLGGPGRPRRAQPPNACGFPASSPIPPTRIPGSSVTVGGA